MQIEQLFIDDLWLPGKIEQLPKLPSFYEKEMNQKIAALSFVLISLIGFVFRYYKGSSLLLLTGLSPFVWDLYSEYHDPKVRKELRKELESGKLSIEEYVAKHGWEKIKTFGFAIHPLNGSLLSKEELKKKIFEQLQKNFSSFFDKRDSNLVRQRGFLWQCFDQNIFDEEDIKRIRQLLQEKFSSMPFNTLCENYKEIEEFGLLQDFEKEKVKNFLKENWMVFVKIEQEFIKWREKLIQAYQQEKSYLKYPPPIILHEPGKLPVVMPDTYKLNLYYEQLSQMKQRYLKEYQRLKDFRDQALKEFQARFDKLRDL